MSPAEEHLRLRLLTLLDQSPARMANDSLLAAVLADMGHAVSRDRLRATLAWLAEAGLLATRELLAGEMRLVVATLSERGADVAAGRARAPGVARPAPGG